MSKVMVPNRVGSLAKANVVESLKRMLLSRNTQEQLKASSFIVESVQKFENNPVVYKIVIEHYIVNDLCNFLCEASATLQVQLLRNILKSLNIFSTSPIFYKKSYSPQVVTSIIRTIQFLVKENGSENIIDHALRFLSEIFFGVNKYKMPSILSRESMYNVLQLFEMLTAIFDKISYETQTKLSSSLVLHSAIYHNKEESIITAKTLSCATVAINKCLEILYQLLIDSKYKYSLENKLDCVFGMLCQICIDSLHFSEKTKLLRLDFKTTLSSDDEDDEILAHKKTIQHTVFLTLDHIVSQIKNFEMQIIVPNYNVFLEFLYEILHRPLPQDEMLIFAKKLCDYGFLPFLGKLIPMSKNTRKLCLMNMAELLSVMSVENLNLSKWPGGESSFRRHLFEGLFESDSNFKRWPLKLNDVYASDATINSLIVYIYFNCLTSPCPQNIAAPLLSYFVEYISNLPANMKCPDPILKCLWFIFALAYLNNTGYSTIEGGVLKLQKTINVISKLIQYKVKDVYTHHPVILKWVFSSNRIPTTIQQQVLSIWLQTETDVPNELASIPDLWYLLLEIITQSSDHNTISVSSNLMKYCIDKYSAQDDNIKHIIWETLPIAMASLAVGNQYTCAESVLRLLELCSTCIPRVPSLSTVQRTASLLPKMLTIYTKKSLDVQFHFVTEAYCLLLAALKQEDKQVLAQFINSPQFLQYIYDATLSINPVLSKTALQLLSLSTFYRVKYNIKCENFIKLDPASLVISLREEKDRGKTIAILQLLYTIFSLKISKEKSFVMLSDVYPAEKYINTCRALFFRLQMVCCKDSECESSSAWQCLNMMLQSAAVNNSYLIVVLTSQPWTHKLIAFYLYQNQASKCHKKFLKFIFNWLTCCKMTNGDDKLFSSSDKEVYHVYLKYNILFGTLHKLVSTFGDEEVKRGMCLERAQIITNILNLIYSFFE